MTVDQKILGATEPDFSDQLVRQGKLSPRDLERARLAQKELGGMLGQVLVRLGLVAEHDVLSALSESLGLAQIGLDDLPVPPPDVPGLSAVYLQAQRAYPISVTPSDLTVAMAVPQDRFVTKALQLASGLAVSTLLVSESALDEAWQRAIAVAEPENTPEEPLSDALTDEFGLDADSGDFVERLKDLASEAPVIRLVNQIIGRVTDLRASDIHLEPFDDGLHVRYRIDGVIHNAEVVTPSLSAAVNSRVKLLAHLDIAERRLPQDGRIKTRVKGRELDLRVSTVPTVHGESVVMRVLDKASVRYSLRDMGFESDGLETFNDLLAKPHGVVLVTGPTGSGKTTTLYAALSKLDAAAQKIITVEDPVEYQLEGINQIQVHPQINLSFANALRSILRQDPDIIMIGEMRDAETAQIAVQSALTGHLVLSTLHTNTAAGAVVRLRDMGVEPYLITSAVNGVLAQRLVRRLCDACKAPEALAITALRNAGFDDDTTPRPTIYRAVGCAECRHTGYRGRTGIHEIMVLDDVVRQAIMAHSDANHLHKLAIEQGMRTLYRDGLLKVAAGVTSLEELMRVTQDQRNA